MDFDGILPDVPPGWTNNRLHFFKYMSSETAKIVLKNRTLRWSTAPTLNDPFEMKLQIVADLNQEYVKEKALDQIWRIYSGTEPVDPKNRFGVVLDMLRKRVPNMSKNEFLGEFAEGIDEGFEIIRGNLPRNQKEIDAKLSSIKILSLTTAPDINLMWAHYANSHRGVVLRFRSIPAFDSPFGVAKPIRYSDVRPTLLTEQFLINSLSGLDHIDVSAITESVVYTKMAQWDYEKEWRISSGDGRDKNVPFEDLPFGKNEVDGIIFGLRISDADRSAIYELAGSYPNIEFMAASLHHHKISIDPV